MKKVLCLLAVLAMASVSLAGTITIVAEQVGDDLAISYTADTEVLGLALTVTTADGSITGYIADSTDAYFDVYIDMASELTGDPTTWNLTAGTPLATVAAAGQATLPATAVSVCLGHLEGVTTPATSGKVATLAVEPGTYVITADALRGGAVDADGPMTIVLPAAVAIVIDDVCLGDVNGDGIVNVSDILQIITLINTQANQFGDVTPVPAGFESADINGDGMINVSDILLVITHINTNGNQFGDAPCM